jgi:putative SOS response-associated peptidase YedK
MPTLHNARSDRVAAAPSWRGPFTERRAVIPAAGYYEWLPTEDADGKPVKQPYYIHPTDGILSLPGLSELWPDPAKDPTTPTGGCGRRRSSPTTPPGRRSHRHGVAQMRAGRST